MYEKNAPRLLRALPVSFFNGVVAIALLMFAHASAAQTYMALRTCATGSCDSFSALRLDARGYAISTSSTLPVGSLIVSSSYSIPLSAYFRVCIGGRGERNACPITPDDIAAIDLDNSTHVRALAFAPITIPPETANSILRGRGATLHHDNDQRHGPLRHGLVARFDHRQFPVV